VPTHRVQSEIVLDVAAPTRIALQVAVADRPAVRTETDELTLLGADGPLPVAECAVDHGGRVHLVDAPAGPVTVRYEAEVAVSEVAPELLAPADELRSLLPSRYCPSDRLAGFAARQIGAGDTSAGTVARVTGFVTGHLQYVSGSTGPLDSALDVLLTGTGVCRDYGHLVVALCRALGVPARFAGVYAPGLDPMDFHAVAEVAVDGAWQVVDATGLAPRGSLLRVATGRDAADTAFLTTLGADGAASLVSCTVSAVVLGDLPADDPAAVVRLP
jgi:transglutaminase-like putative cysteine protease